MSLVARVTALAQAVAADIKALYARSATVMPVVTQATPLTKTLALTDVGTYTRLNNTIAFTVTIPTQATVAWADGAEVTFEQAGTGKITFAPAAGVTLNRIYPATLTTAGQYAVVTLKRVSSNTWTLFGALGT